MYYVNCVFLAIKINELAEYYEKFANFLFVCGGLFYMRVKQISNIELVKIDIN